MASIRPDQELHASNPDKEVLEETPEMADSPFRAPFNQMANAVRSFANEDGVRALMWSDSAAKVREAAPCTPNQQKVERVAAHMDKISIEVTSVQIEEMVLALEIQDCDANKTHTTNQQDDENPISIRPSPQQQIPSEVGLQQVEIQNDLSQPYLEIEVASDTDVPQVIIGQQQADVQIASTQSIQITEREQADPQDSQLVPPSASFVLPLTDLGDLELD
ncbi:hypothetical protein DAPPUDRAFT_323519 [Daphnia pulex]|uniref:Uncharacterized protein n=1 Tax=Daphnia pulex TaxID=6669 RepID=E9GZ11_DAPPU|nr:hypothetical protein DAPPUDRAFT_323519 [Daphnia pulex]|eukprot:EFX75248.1 hypothetical protein DAPPUDRAFT_323519 [Daphnia pulex]